MRFHDVSPLLRAFFVVFAVGLFVALWVYGGHNEAAQPLKPVDALHESRPVMRSVVSLESVKSEFEDGGGVRSLLALYKSTADKRVFAEKAVATGGDGAYLYSVAVAAECRRLLMMFGAAGLAVNGQLVYRDGEDPSVYSLRLAAHEKARATCGSFLTQEVDFEAELLRQSSGLAGRDGLEQKRLAFLSALQSKDAGRTEFALREIFAAKDPLLLASLGKRPFVHDSGGYFFYLNGAKYPVEQDGGYGLAVELLPCRFGMTCDQWNADVIFACVSEGRCYSSKEELIMAGLVDQQERDAVLGIVNQLVDVVNLADPSRILPSQ